MAARGKYKDRKMTITPKKEDGSGTFLGTCEDQLPYIFPWDSGLLPQSCFLSSGIWKSPLTCDTNAYPSYFKNAP